MRNLLILIPMLALSGCYKTNLVNLSADGSPGEVTRVWSHAFLYGLVPATEVDLSNACGDKGVWAVSTRVNGWQVLLGGITYGIYAPSTAKITCKG